MGALYERIQALCQERGIKGAKLCAELGISKGLLTDLKMGRRSGVSAVTAQKIADYFGVTVGYLLGQEEKKPASLPGDELNRVLSGVDFALYGEVQDLTEAQKRDVLTFIQFIKQKD